MKTVLVVAFLAVVAGCGIADDNELAGTTWALSTGACGEAVSFNHTDGYALVFGCKLPNGDVGIQQESGDYVAVPPHGNVGGSHLLTYPTKTSCPAQTGNESVPYHATQTTLTIETTDNVLVFSRAADGATSGVAALGCFADDGTFTPGPLVDF